MLCFGLIIPGVSSAQVNKKNIYALPEAYLHPSGPHERDLKINKCPPDERSQEDWVVYSDRELNQTFSDPKLSKPFKTIHFMEPFFVIEEYCQEGVVRIIKFDKSIIKNRTKKEIDPSLAIDMGYISKSKLLLWRHSLVDDTTNFTIKGLPGHSLEVYQEKLNSRNFSKNQYEIRLFDSPELKNSNNQSVRLFEFLYVYKKEGEALLLGKSDRFTVSQTTEIIGWVHKNYVFEWNQRLCLEPNPDGEAVSERASKKVKAGLLENISDANRFYQSPAGVKMLLERDPGKEIFSPYVKRFPIIKMYPNEVVYTRAATDIYGSNNAELMSVEKQADYLHKFNSQSERTKKFNVVFVVEASTRIEKEYLKSVLQGLQDVDKELLTEDESKQKEYLYKWGAVVYRSYDHSKCAAATDIVSPSIPLSDNISDVQDFLANQISQTYRCDNLSRTKALYKGIDKALNLFKDTTETNIVVIIGSVGDPATSMDSKMLVNKMVQFKTSIIAFQYYNANGAEFESFLLQTGKLITESSKKITQGIAKYKDVVPQFQPLNDAYLLDIPKTSAIPGKALISSNNFTMPPERLREELKNTLANLQTGIGNLVSGGSSLLEGVGNRNVQLDLPLMLFLKNAGINVDDPSILKDFSSENFQLFVPCYAVVRPQSLNQPLFRHVILISESEFANLRIIMEELDKVANSLEIRNQLVKTFKQILIDHYGESEAKKAFNKNLADVLQLVTGLPSKTELLKKYSIRDLESEKKVPEDKISIIVNGISDKLKGLKKIAYDTSGKYSFISSGDKYFWISQDDLP